MLAPYRKEAVLNPENRPIPTGRPRRPRGRHYLSALAINAATGNEECRRRMEYMLEELNLCAEANDKRNEPWSRNYVGGFPNSANCGRHSVKAISAPIRRMGSIL
ncbi:hypothetical protein [Muribaculum gordoncarteri]|uniref:hypothetical protein n=1 Tax=Muribaculum gordoncarteri TaxID=2530390 RepID=UPI003F664B08